MAQLLSPGVSAPSKTEFFSHRRQVLEDLLGEFDNEVFGACMDARQHVRIGRARGYFDGSMRLEQLPELQGVYKYWVFDREVMLLKGTCFETGETKKLAVPCSKRGNDVFNDRLDRKLSFLERVRHRKAQFFDISAFTPDRKVTTNILWITLTNDSKRCSLDDSWKNDSADLNLWITNLRNHYGHIKYLQFPQAFPGPGAAHGYVHHHGILIFQDAEFSVFPSFRQNEDGSEQLVYRIHEKGELEAQGKWHSFIDVQALSSIRATVNYCRKYAQGTYAVATEEGSVNEEAVLNCSLTWFYGKNTYSMSRDFRRALSDLIKASLHDSKVLQATLDGSEAIPLWKWELIGFRGFAELLKAGLDPPEDRVFVIEDPAAWDHLVRRDYEESWRHD